MSCSICGNKPANCDCTKGDRQAYELQDELDRLRAENEEMRRELTGYGYFGVEAVEKRRVEQEQREKEVAREAWMACFNWLRSMAAPNPCVDGLISEMCVVELDKYWANKTKGGER